jgi:hypothetical protein
VRRAGAALSLVSAGIADGLPRMEPWVSSHPPACSVSVSMCLVFLGGYTEILRQYPPETHTPRAEAPRRATQRERL